MPDTILIAGLILLLCLLGVGLRFAGHRQAVWLELALTNMGDAMLMTDRRGRIVKLNQVAETLTGWTSREARGKSSSQVLRMMDHDTRAPVSSPVEQVIETGKISGWVKNMMLVSRSGEERPVDFCAARVSGKAAGSVRAIVLIFRDNTGRYFAEQKLRESEELMRAVTNATQLGLVMIDRDRRYIYANNFYRQMVGAADLKLLGRRISEVLPLVYEQIRPNLDRAFAGERVTYEIKGVQNKEKGLNRSFSVSYEPQMRQSLVVHVVIVVLDITHMEKRQDS